MICSCNGNNILKESAGLTKHLHYTLSRPEYKLQELQCIHVALKESRVPSSRAFHDSVHDELDDIGCDQITSQIRVLAQQIQTRKGFCGHRVVRTNHTAKNISAVV
jgi:hypothetical protein